jgi:hypothetical protein
MNPDDKFIIKTKGKTFIVGKEYILPANTKRIASTNTVTDCNESSLYFIVKAKCIKIFNAPCPQSTLSVSFAQFKTIKLIQDDE